MTYLNVNILVNNCRLCFCIILSVNIAIWPMEVEVIDMSKIKSPFSVTSVTRPSSKKKQEKLI